MKRLVSGFAFSGALLAISSAPLLAQGYGSRRVRSVPEIDASAGLLAVAAVLVVLAFVWERRRRAA